MFITTGEAEGFSQGGLHSSSNCEENKIRVKWEDLLSKMMGSLEKDHKGGAERKLPSCPSVLHYVPSEAPKQQQKHATGLSCSSCRALWKWYLIHQAVFQQEYLFKASV